jgi:hypothetical protein
LDDKGYDRIHDGDEVVLPNEQLRLSNSRPLENKIAMLNMHKM